MLACAARGRSAVRSSRARLMCRVACGRFGVLGSASPALVCPRAGSGAVGVRALGLVAAASGVRARARPPAALRFSVPSRAGAVLSGGSAGCCFERQTVSVSYWGRTSSAWPCPAPTEKKLCSTFAAPFFLTKQRQRDIIQTEPLQCVILICHCRWFLSFCQGVLTKRMIRDTMKAQRRCMQQHTQRAQSRDADPRLDRFVGRVPKLGRCRAFFCPHPPPAPRGGSATPMYDSSATAAHAVIRAARSFCGRPGVIGGFVRTLPDLPSIARMSRVEMNARRP